MRIARIAACLLILSAARALAFEGEVPATHDACSPTADDWWQQTLDLAVGRTPTTQAASCTSASVVQEAKSGCCSHHGGVCGCDSNTGHQLCCDGADSPSCGC